MPVRGPPLLPILLLCAFARMAQAQVSPAGGDFQVLPASRNAAVAYDANRDVYLVVSGNGTVQGRFVSADGEPLGAGAFPIQASAHYGHLPRAVFGAGAYGGQGAFLVTWHESDRRDGGTSVHARLVRFGDGAVADDHVLSVDGSFWEAAANVAWAEDPGSFLVVWAGAGEVHGRQVSAGGAPVGGVIDVTATPEHERDPSVAFDASRGEFVVAFSAYGGPGPAAASVGAQRVSAATFQPVGAHLPLHEADGTFMTDVAYDAARGRCLVAWFQTAPAGGIYGRLVEGGAAVSAVLPLSFRFAAYDAVSLAWSASTGTFLFVSHDSESFENGGVEISADGVPGPDIVYTSIGGGAGNFYPRLAAHASRPQWLLVTTHAFVTAQGQRLDGVAPPVDAGTEPAPDAGDPPDAGAPADAGTSAAPDGGEPSDAGESRPPPRAGLEEVGGSCGCGATSGTAAFAPLALLLALGLSGARRRAGTGAAR